MLLASQGAFDKKLQQLKEENALAALEQLKADEKVETLAQYIKSLSAEQQDLLRKAIN